MTSRGLYEGLLIELHNENAPNILLEDFNYFANKAVYQYIHKRYNIYDINQQTTDDLRVLKATAKLIPKIEDRYQGLTLADHVATYYVDLPDDYLHLLNCICVYNVKKTYKCYNKGDTWRAAALKLTADAYSQVLNNFWQLPTYKRPYYYIHHINSYTDNETLLGEVPTNWRSSANPEGTDNSVTTSGEVDGNNHSILSVTRDNNLGIKIGGAKASLVERSAGVRYGNVTKVRMEIRYGTDNSVFSLTPEDGLKGGFVYIDYIKTPLHIRLTQKELDTTEDTSQMLEYPDYVCQEILNELIHIVMETTSNLRLQTHPVVSLSIANPTQALAPEAAGQSAQ